jgi:positive regulator of sigma E activity
MRRQMLARGLAACTACTALTACSTQQLYAIGQQWQRNQCQKIDDRAQRTRCEDSVALSFDEYQVQRQDAAKR